MQTTLLVGESKLEFLVNDLSLHNQFNSLLEFKGSVERIMEIRGIVSRFHRELRCHRNILRATVLQEKSLQQAVPEAFGHDQQRAIMQWLCKQGPFWDDERHHGAEDYFECRKSIVTDTAVGEAAYLCHHGEEHHLVSFSPSDWEDTPLTVYWRFSDGSHNCITVCNHWSKETIETTLDSIPVKIKSWQQLEAYTKNKFTNIKFSADCFNYLRGNPFANTAANQINMRLNVLNEYQLNLNNNGQRNDVAHRIYNDYFTGDKGWFSDSSATEKRKFRNDLTFKHPDQHGKQLECTWHGKINNPQLRIHFSWPDPTDAPLYVVYVGPKITKK